MKAASQYLPVGLPSITLITRSGERGKLWLENIKNIFGENIKINIQENAMNSHPIILLDEELPNVYEFIMGLDRHNRAVFLITQDGDDISELYTQNWVDDCLVFPFRKMELLSKFKSYEQILRWNEVIDLNSTFSSALGRLQENLYIAERLQKARLPSRFGKVKGFKVQCRYLAGLKSGGDYFDIAETQDQKYLSMVLSDSSSYGLASAVLSVLMRVTLKLSIRNLGVPGILQETIRQIHSELLLTLKEKDQLSLFFGVVSRQEQYFQYVSLGSIVVYYQEEGKEYRILPAQGDAISRQKQPQFQEAEPLKLSPGSRIILVSNGFVESMGGQDLLRDHLNQCREKTSVDILNELAFQVKKKLNEDEEMPPRDCTAMIFDADSRVFKLTKRGQDES